MTRSFKQASDRLNKSKQEKYPLIPGFLGFMVNGVETVEVPTRAGYVYVRLRGVTNEVISAFNDEVSPVYNLPVLVTRDDTDNTRYRVAARDTGVYINWGGASSYLPRHGDSHSFAGTAGSGGDVVWVYGRQMMPLNVIPSGTVGSGNVYVMPGVYYQAGAWKYGGDEYSESFLPAKPTGTLARMMLLYLNEAGDLGIATGTTFSSSLSGTAAILPYVPNLSSNYYVPLAGIRLTAATSVVTWGDIYDLRPWIVGDGFIPTGTFAPNSSPFVTVAGSTDLTAERVLTAGPGISIVDNGANSTVVISVTGSFSTSTGSSGGSGGTSIPIYDDMVIKGTGTALNFADNLWVNFSGTTAHIGANLNTIIVKKADTANVSIEYPTTNAGLTNAITKATAKDEVFVPAGNYTFNGNILDLSKGISIIGQGSSNTYIYINDGTEPWAIKTAESATNPPSRIEGVFFDIESSYTATGTVTLSGGLYAKYVNIKDVGLSVYHDGGGYIDADFFYGAYINNEPGWLGSYIEAPETNIDGLYISLLGEGETNLNYIGLEVDNVHGEINDFSVVVDARQCTDATGLLVDHNDTNLYDQRFTNGYVNVIRSSDLQNVGGNTYGIKTETSVDAGYYKLILDNVSVFAKAEVEYDDPYYVYGVYNSYDRSILKDSKIHAVIDPILGFDDTGKSGPWKAWGVYSDADMLIKNVEMTTRSGNALFFAVATGGDGVSEHSYFDCTFEQLDNTAYGGVSFEDGNAFYYNCSVNTVTFPYHYELHTGLWGSGTSDPSRLSIYDDSVFKVSGTAISFGDNLTVAVTGSVAFVGLDVGILKLTEQLGDPSSPPTGIGYLFAKTDGKIYYKNSSGTVFDLTI